MQKSQPQVFHSPSADEAPQPLDAQSLNTFRAQQVERGTPVRFIYRGSAVDIVSGQVQDPATPVSHQITYWNFDRATALAVAEITRTKPVFAH
ncbi:hypothetical protein LJR189_004639 [Acidovorax delafieldii]|uniref:hypothetical protein n=1 Tax=Acidovorax delafieldii TaxID=47920 RepID=UPI003ECE0398